MNLRKLENGLNQIGSHELEYVSYDLHELRVSVRLKDDRLAYVIFKDSLGHRLLDEGDFLDLLPLPDQTAWLCEVSEGGWMDECKNLNRLVSHLSDVREFFVAGANECINVFSYSEPTVYATTENDGS